MRRFSALPGTLRGVFWMVLQCVCFASLSAAVRQLSTTMSPGEIVFFRSLFGLLFMAPWLARTGIRAFRPPRLGLVTMRNVLVFCAMLAWFAALSAIPISDAIALQFTLPLFVVAGAGLFLGETVGARRWAAVAVGFAGALVIVRPGIIEVSGAALLVLLSAVIYAAVHLMTKSFSRDVPGPYLVFHMNLVVLPLGLGFALPDWAMPVWADVPWLIAMGVFGTLAHLCMTKAYRAADASFVEPVDFARLPIAALLGWVLFREASDFWTWAGAAIMFAAVSFNTRHETRAGRAAPER